jgi:hypothetical protein
MAADLNRAHMGRIVDYWLGGQHNYSIDREAAARTEAVYPAVPRLHREHRKFMKRAIAYLIWNQDIHHFIDFGSALPTCGNVHEAALEYDPDAVVIYSDNDPEMVQYGQEILEKAGLPNVRYEWADASRPEELLNSSVVRELLGDERRVCFGLTALPHLLSDEELARTTSQLYAWAAKGSHLITSFANEKFKQVDELQQLTRGIADAYYRSITQTLKLIEPWQVTEHGITYIYWPETTEPTDVLGTAHHVFLARK